MNTILNISSYRFVPIEDPVSLANRLRTYLSQTSILGTVLIAPEGWNMFLAGPEAAVRAFCAFCDDDVRFVDMHAKESWSDYIPFRRLVVKCKSEVIRMNTPYTEDLYSPLLPARVLKSWLDQQQDDDGRDLVILDTRNTFEYEYGHFDQAIHLSLSVFSEFPEKAQALKPYQDRTIVSYCTGGVRCEKVGAVLRACGFDRVYQLDGGILRYFEEVGGAHYVGSCFVFDQRIALNADGQPAASLLAS